jgi:hypothetical protein
VVLSACLRPRAVCFFAIPLLSRLKIATSHPVARFREHEAFGDRLIDSTGSVGVALPLFQRDKHEKIGSDRTRKVPGGYSEVSDVSISRGGCAAGLIPHIGPDL